MSEVNYFSYFIALLIRVAIGAWMGVLNKIKFKGRQAGKNGLLFQSLLDRLKDLSEDQYAWVCYGSYKQALNAAKRVHTEMKGLKTEVVSSYTRDENEKILFQSHTLEVQVLAHDKEETL